jgi:gluconokinase
MPLSQHLGFVVMGVSGSGKTTLGKDLAQKLGWDFYLNDSDRAPWLALLHDQLLSTLKADRYPVLACSVLKESYRAQLLNDINGIDLIYLKGSYDVIWSRMSSREAHYMKPEMLKSQFDILEEPQDAFVLDVSTTLDGMLKSVMNRYFPDKD